MISVDEEQFERARIKRAEALHRADIRKKASIAAAMLSQGLPSFAENSDTDEATNTNASPARHQSVTVDAGAILAATLDLWEEDVKRQERIAEASDRRSKEIKARHIRKQERAREKQLRAEQLFVMSSVPSRTASTPQPAVSSNLPTSPQRSTTSLKKLKHKEHREVLSQGDLDRIAFEKRNQERAEFNKRRLENLARMADKQRTAQQEKELFEQELEHLALRKEEFLLEREIRERRQHFEIMDHIAAPASHSTQASLRRKELLRSANELSGITKADLHNSSVASGPQHTSSSAGMMSSTSAARNDVSQLLQFVHSKRHAPWNDTIDHKWQEKFHRTAVKVQQEDAAIAHAEKMKHLDLVRNKKLESLATIAQRKEKERAALNKRFEEEMEDARKAFIDDVNNAKSQFTSTRDEERKRLQRFAAAKELRQKDINERVTAMKAKDLEDLEQAMKTHQSRQKQLATEADEERERRMCSVQLMQYANYKKAMEDRQLRCEQSQRLQQAEEQRQQDAAEKRRLIEVNQTRHAGNMLRFRMMVKDARDISQSDTEAFYTNSISRPKPRPGDVLHSHKSTSPSLHDERSAQRGNNGNGKSRHTYGDDDDFTLPPHKELKSIESFASGDISAELLSSIHLADAQMNELKKKRNR